MPPLAGLLSTFADEGLDWPRPPEPELLSLSEPDLLPPLEPDLLSPPEVDLLSPLAAAPDLPSPAVAATGATSFFAASLYLSLR